MEITKPGNVNQASITLVNCFADCLIRHDLDIIIKTWMRHRVSETTTPLQRLKEMFRVLMRKEMTLEIDDAHLILFSESPENMHIRLSDLHPITQEVIKAFLIQGYIFFDSVDYVTIQYARFKKFKYISVFKSTPIWIGIAVKFIELIVYSDVNKNYLGNRGAEIVLCFVIDEIAYTYDQYEENHRNAKTEWLLRHKMKSANLQMMLAKLLNLILGPDPSKQEGMEKESADESSVT
jgi:hypothetical protein